MIKFDFTGKIVLVTASSKGIGFAIAKAFFDSGAMVCLCARTLEELQKSANILASVDKDRVFFLQGDIADIDFLETLVTQTQDYFKGEINILINNSGGPKAASIKDLTDQDWLTAIDSNLLSVVRLSGLIAEGMKNNKWGRIINLT